MVGMLSSKERVIECLESMPEGICDDCLSKQSKVYPRQQVNSICRNLSDIGKVKREKVICPLCCKLKTSNFLFAGEAAPSFVSVGKALREPALAYGASERLDSIRREIIGILNKVDPVRKAQAGNRETFSERLSGLQSEGRVPNTICTVIRLINSFRNLAVYESCILGSEELAFLEEAWRLVGGWWSKMENRQE